MADLLSSGALLATVLSLFYTLWYPEISAALTSIKPKDQPVDSEKDITRVKEIRRRRVMPLMVGAVIMLAALLPDAIASVRRSVSLIGQPHTRYDAVGALYVAMTFFVAGLAVHTFGLLREVGNLLKRLEHRK